MFEQLLARMTETQVLVAPEGQATFVAGIQGMVRQYDGLSIEQREEMAAAADDDFWPDEDSWMARHRPYRVRDGILTIPVSGSLISDFGWVFDGWVTGYDYIWRAYERGMDDPEVKGIVFKINSPGGEVSGNFDLVDFLASRRDEKPTLAAASDHAYSAAYNIAASASEVTVTRTGGVGSIGVVTMHIDLSEYMKKLGIGVTFVHAGKHKVDGNPYEPLKPEVKKRMQSRIYRLYSIFVSTVARNRGMDEQAIRDTEALTYSAEEGVSVGLADAVSSFDDAMAAFAGKLATSDGALQMTDSTKKPSAATSEATQEALDAARTEGFEAGKAEGRAEGVKAAHERFQGILGCEEAKARTAAALNLAVNTELPVDNAKVVLAGLPEEKQEVAPTKGSGHFQAAMGKDNPEIDAGADTGSDGEDADASAAILRDFHAASGQPAKAQ